MDNNLKPIEPLNGQKASVDIPEIASPIEEKPKAPIAAEANKTTLTGPHAVIAKKSSNRPNKIIIAIVALLILAGAIFFLFFYRVRVLVGTNPAPDKVTVDGTVISSKSFYLMPGKHKIVIERKDSVSYFVNRNFNKGEKLNLNFTFKPAPKAGLIETGATMLQGVQSKIYFVNADKSVGYLFGGDKTSVDIIKATNATYPTIKKYSLTEDGEILMVLDNEAIKLIDQAGSDIVNQAQAKLPFDGSKIGTFDSNPSGNSYFDGANKYIAFDQTDSQWILRLVSRDLARDEIVSTLDSTKYKNLKIEWLSDNQTIVLTGGYIGKIELTSRTYSELSTETNFSFSKASPDGAKILAVNSDGKGVVFEQDKSHDIDLPNLAPTCYFIDNSSALLYSNGRLVEYNFDTGNSIGYAGGEQVLLPTGLAIYGETLYYTNTQGLFAIDLVKEEY